MHSSAFRGSGPEVAVCVCRSFDSRSLLVHYCAVRTMGAMGLVIIIVIIMVGVSHSSKSCSPPLQWWCLETRNSFNGSLMLVAHCCYLVCLLSLFFAFTTSDLYLSLQQAPEVKRRLPVAAGCTRAFKRTPTYISCWRCAGPSEGGRRSSPQGPEATKSSNPKPYFEALENP